MKETVEFILKARKKFAEKNKPKKDIIGFIVCPKCGGKLHMRQSAYNGHVSGGCETMGCLSWAE